MSPSRKQPSLSTGSQAWLQRARTASSRKVHMVVMLMSWTVNESNCQFALDDTQWMCDSKNISWLEVQNIENDSEAVEGLNVWIDKLSSPQERIVSRTIICELEIDEVTESNASDRYNLVSDREPQVYVMYHWILRMTTPELHRGSEGTTRRSPLSARLNRCWPCSGPWPWEQRTHRLPRAFGCKFSTYCR